MGRELWPLLYPLILLTAKDFHQKYVRYQPWLLVMVFLWAALHDRPIAWACQRRHWNTTTESLPRRPDHVARLDTFPF